MNFQAQLVQAIHDSEKRARSLGVVLAKGADPSDPWDSLNPENLNTILQSLAAAIAARAVYRRATHVPVESIQRWVIAGLSFSTDDTWSGRGNDLQRVERDAKVEAYKRVLAMYDTCT